MHLVFEGPDGSGKTSQMTGLYEDLIARGYPKDKIFVLHQPGSTELGDKLRAICKDKEIRASGPAQFYMMAADHSQFVDEKLRPIKEGREKDDYLILQDRHSVVSGWAYQVHGNGVSKQSYKYTYDNPELVKHDTPDMVLVFKPTIETILSRIGTRGEATDRYEKEDFLKKVLTGYSDLAFLNERFMNTDVELLNANRTLSEVKRDMYQRLMYKAVGSFYEDLDAIYKGLANA